MLKIRQGIPTDAEALSQLALQCIQKSNYSDQQRATIEPYIIFNASHFPLYYFGIVEDPMIIGFYVLNFIDKNKTELKGIYVQSQHQRKGYGQALVKHAKIQTRVLGASELLLASTIESEGFFQKLGAKPTASKALAIDEVFCVPMSFKL